MIIDVYNLHIEKNALLDQKQIDIALGFFVLKRNKTPLSQ